MSNSNSINNRFRRTYLNSGIPAATTMETIMRMLSNITTDGNIEVFSDAYGIHFYVDPSAAESTTAGTPGPFDKSAFDTDTDTLTLTTGYYVEHAKGGTTFYEPSSYDVVLSAGDNYIHLKVVFGSPPTVTLERSAAKDTIQSSNSQYVEWLWYIDYTDGVDPDMTDRDIAQKYHFGNVKLPQ